MRNRNLLISATAFLAISSFAHADSIDEAARSADFGNAQTKLAMRFVEPSADLAARNDTEATSNYKITPQSDATEATSWSQLWE